MGELVGTGSKAGLNPGPRYGWYGASVLVLLATAGIGWAAYRQLPDQLPMHWNAAGRADDFAGKGFWPVFALPVAGLGVTALLLATAAAGVRLPLQSPPGSEAARRRASANLRASQFFLGVTALALALLMSWLALRTWFLPADGSPLDFLLPTALFLAFLALGAVAAHRGYRREIGVLPAGAGRVGEEAEDPAAASRHWKAGVIYLNRADPRVFVPKRRGIGVTVNAATPGGAAFYAVLLLIALTGLALPLFLQ